MRHEVLWRERMCVVLVGIYTGFIFLRQLLVIQRINTKHYRYILSASCVIPEVVAYGAQ